MMPTRYSPKPGTTIKVDGRTFKVVADVDEINCLKCAFYPKKGQHRCQLPIALGCLDVHFVEVDESAEKKTHKLSAERIESERLYWLATAVATIILIGIYIYKIIEN